MHNPEVKVLTLRQTKQILWCSARPKHSLRLNYNRGYPVICSTHMLIFLAAQNSFQRAEDPTENAHCRFHTLAPRSKRAGTLLNRSC
jgi:hypothetical protein